jgi:hypothetical protein
MFENAARDGLRLAGQIISRDFAILGRCRERLEAVSRLTWWKSDRSGGV